MTQPTTITDLRTGFADPPSWSAPMMRWWWFGPSIERTEIDRELTAIRDAGLGGVEVSYVYPLAPPTTTYLSDQFLDDLRYAADRARALGLRFDLTLGSGWSFGGPHVTAGHAARTLHWEHREIHPGPIEIPAVSSWPGDELVAAFVGAGSIQEQPDTCLPLRIADQMIMVPDGDGTRHVLLAYARHTGQNVKRATAGAEGPVLDHYSAKATAEHLRQVGDKLLRAVPGELLGSVFCDSLEVYSSDWTPGLLAEFERRRGYDPAPLLYRLAVDGPEAAVFRADYHQTLAELYQDNFVTVIQRWAAERGVPFRIQGYGTPPATVSSYRFADLFEGEGWGWTEITQTRWASSAAHLYGKDVVSSETWTWVHSPSFRATPLDLKGEAHEHLLAGINQLIGHGWPYSPSSAPGLGWMFYAAGALDDRNPWWPAMRLLSRYLTRLCWLLRQGEPVADVLLYVPNRDLFARMGLAVGGSLDTWREAKALIGDEIPQTIRAGGWNYDLIDDDAIGQVPVDQSRVVIVPRATLVPQATQIWLRDLVRTGGSVIVVDSALELPGARVCTSVDLAGVLAAALAPDVRLTPAPDSQDPTSHETVGSVHRRTADADVYFLANTGSEPRSVTVAPRTGRKRYQEWDAHTGRVVRAGSADDVQVTLQPYEATVLIFTDAAADDDVEVSPTATGPGRRVDLDTGWSVRFAGSATIPIAVPHAWEDTPDRIGYSGAASYTTTQDLTDLPAGARVLLDFGETTPTDTGSADVGGMRGHSYRAMVSTPVREVAVVRVNGIECGIAWAPPYRVDITSAVRTGANQIEVVVHNTAANRLAADDAIVELAAASDEHHGRRFRMQELDLAMDGVRSGLLTVPGIVITS